jgi:peptide-methionine (S)-S-oxide reductase
VKGVKEAVSGYAGGTTKNPSYEDVSTGNTGHAESVVVYYDSSEISYPQLLKVYFEAQEDPTQVNGQGPDHGTEYRSIVFYKNAQEKAMAEQYINEMNHSGRYKKPISTQVMPYTTFWKAEDYHQDYIAHNPDNPYVQSVSIPDVKKFQQKYPAMIKPGKKL